MISIPNGRPCTTSKECYSKKCLGGYCCHQPKCKKCKGLICNECEDGFKLFNGGCIPPVDKDPDEYFSELRNLNIKNSFNDLSIGMSSDYEKAIKYDSTFVRVGSSIFKENSN